MLSARLPRSPPGRAAVSSGQRRAHTRKGGKQAEATSPSSCRRAALCWPMHWWHMPTARLSLQGRPAPAYRPARQPCMPRLAGGRWPRPGGRQPFLTPRTARHSLRKQAAAPWCLSRLGRLCARRQAWRRGRPQAWPWGRSPDERSRSRRKRAATGRRLPPANSHSLGEAPTQAPRLRLPSATCRSGRSQLAVTATAPARPTPVQPAPALQVPPGSRGAGLGTALHRSPVPSRAAGRYRRLISKPTSDKRTGPGQPGCRRRAPVAVHGTVPALAPRADKAQRRRRSRDRGQKRPAQPAQPAQRWGRAKRAPWQAPLHRGRPGPHKAMTPRPGKRQHRRPAKPTPHRRLVLPWARAPHAQPGPTVPQRAYP